MICCVKPVLREGLCVVQKEEFSVTCNMYEMYIWQKAKHIHKRFIRDKPIFSTERMLHKDYYRKDSVGGKIYGRVSEGVWRQDKLFSGKPPVVK
jgi:hypothetical protein